MIKNILFSSPLAQARYLNHHPGFIETSAFFVNAERVSGIYMLLLSFNLVNIAFKLAVS